MKREEQELLARTGAGTPMGELLRRYWTPALLSREIETGGAAIRVRLFGEDLVAFRSPDNKVGLFAENCAHRGASLSLAKNEAGGLRCWYHGWKYDVDGKCIDQPNEPPSSQVCEKIAQPAYPCIEKNGVVWSYLGPREDMPPFPALEWTAVPEGHYYASKRFQECNWLTGMDGDLDSSHLNFLHGQETIAASPSHGRFESGKWMADDAYPKFEVVPRPSGFIHGARRNADEANHYWRIGTWLLPCFTMIPGFPGDLPMGGHAWVPRDDETTWCFAFSWHPLRPLKESELKQIATGWGMHSLLAPGSFVPAYNKSNGYAPPDVARDGQHWARIKIFQDQDVAITESIGGAFDLTNETLGSTDIVIISARRRLMAEARALAEGKKPRITAEDFRVRPISCVLPRDAKSWADAVGEAIDARPETYRPSI
jgi:phenylpropionate dioxygenase-like ring-hydroxylating dioxygenase large terminal subunit